MDFYLTKEDICPYKVSEISKKVFTKIEKHNCDIDTVNLLFENGFRRDHNFIYKNRCLSCDDCKSLRVLVNDFSLHKTQKRIYGKINKNIYISATNTASHEHFNLFKKYECERHKESEMAKMSFDNFILMIEDAPIESYLYEFREIKSKKLKACMIVDHLTSGLSAVYSFYDVSDLKESLGTFMVLKMIEWCKTLNIPYFYLGYYIKNLNQMAYKENFKPFEIFDNNKWQGTLDF